MKKKIVCILLAAALAFSVPTRALAFGFAIPLAVEEVVIMLLGLCGITVSDDFDVDEFIADVQEQLDETGSNLTFASFLSGAAASKVLNTVAVDYAEIFSAVLSTGNEQAANSADVDFVAGCPRVINGPLFYSQGSTKVYMWSGVQPGSSAYSTPLAANVYVASVGGYLVYFTKTENLQGNYYITYQILNNSRYDGVIVSTSSGEYSISGTVSSPFNSSYVRYFSDMGITVPNFNNIQALKDALQNIDNAPAGLSVSDDVINGNATDIDYNSVNDRGVLTGAFSIDMGAIADAFGSIADAWSGVREKVRSWADVVSAGRVIPAIDGKVIEDTATNDSIVSETTVSDAAASIGDVGDYDLGLENFFPFCLPWDLYNFITLLEATPEAPVIEWEFPVDVEGNTEHYEWSLEDLEYLAEILRTFLTLAFAVGLIFVGGKLFKH